MEMQGFREMDENCHILAYRRREMLLKTIDSCWVLLKRYRKIAGKSSKVIGGL
jgi:hypothetical protein